MSNRFLQEKLEKWFSSYKKPLIIDGARQVGKTTTIRNFLDSKNTNYIFIDFKQLHNNEILKIIKNDNIDVLVNFIEAKYEIKKENMIIFFDEIQECIEIISLLKYFNEIYPYIKVVASGSLFSLEFSNNSIFYPVGKVNIIYMYPITFIEFLKIINRNDLIEKISDCIINKKEIPNNIHEELLNLFNDYIYIGGMPEAVYYYASNNGLSKKVIDDIKDIKNNLLETYNRDIYYHFKSSDMKVKVISILDNLHIQLNNQNKRFMLSMIKESETSTKPRMSRYRNTINKLIISNIVNQLPCVYEIDLPLYNYLDESSFKLFYNDISFYTIRYPDIIPSKMVPTNQTWNSIKGGLYENYVNSELTCYFDTRKFYYYKNKSSTKEIDFVFDYDDKLYLIEVKSNINNKYNSLKNFYCQHNKILIKTDLNNFDFSKDHYINIPIYAIGWYCNLVINRSDNI